MRYVAAHSSTLIELHFVDDCSLSAMARNDLIADLRKNGRQVLADRVARECADCVFLGIQDGRDTWSRWIILPNGDMLLWHYQGWSALGYPPMLTHTWDYYGWKGVGLVVHPGGRSHIRRE
jgi:hypothetical protein